ncbi:hypothetical protein [Nigerium massiliense]|uniref:hypothetical protein n=1 Tax=Nigerium massiliense TaxID=1522317 RepID=UPI001C46A361|nr:hypothetical protein [Nigerium massiliense]
MIGTPAPPDPAPRDDVPWQDAPAPPRPGSRLVAHDVTLRYDEPRPLVRARAWSPTT